MTEDIAFCQNGWEECQVTRCERHPSNIENPQLPHSYAKLYRTEYCPLEKPQPIDAVEVVRCKDCKHYDLAPNGFNGMCNRQYATFYAVDFCSYGERNEAS